MRILGIDYGRKKIGVSFADLSIAEPYGVLKIISWEDAFKKIQKLIQKEEVEKVVIGLSEGSMAQETRDFAEKLNENLKIPIDFQDETLSTKDAQRLSLEANIPRKKRKELEDAYAATLMLQSYLDENN